MTAEESSEPASEIPSSVAEFSLNWEAGPGSESQLCSVAALQNAIHLWVFDLAKTDLGALVQHATDAENRRAQRIRNGSKRRLYLGGRIGLRTLLARYSGLADQELDFGYGARGKPRLLNPLACGELTFNYTLSGDKVLYALSTNRELGVDLELIPRKVNVDLMSRRQLSSREQEALAALKNGEKNNALLACWTRKEAYGKVLGVGIRFYINQVPLFINIANPRFAAQRQGLFERTVDSGMPDLLDGIQIGLPFCGVASIMYARDNQDALPPEIVASTLQ